MAEAQRKEARAVYYPTLNFKANANAQSLYIEQQTLPWGHTADLTGGMALSLNWTVFDGGARRSRLRQLEAEIRRADSQVNVARDSIEDEVWTAYSNLNTAFRQREAATALLESATQSYAAALESYNYGVRNLLDVTAAQKVLARPAPQTSWRGPRYLPHWRIWRSAAATRSRPVRGDPGHEH